MSWVLVLLFLSLAFGGHSEARHEKQLPSAVVVGTVYCDTCFQEEFSKPSHFIPGASVAVECKDGSSRPIFRKEAKTDQHGKFGVHLPFSVSKHVKRIEGCSVTLIRSSEPYCAVASTANSSSLHLKSRKQGMHIFSAGFFTFKPQKQPDLCNQKPSIPTSTEIGSNKDLPPLPKSAESLKTTQSQEKRQGRPDFLLPPLLPSLTLNLFQPSAAPMLPLPPIPVLPLPPIPGLPLPPIPMLPLPPIPGPTPSPPSPAPVFPLPPIPGLTPSPSPSPSPPPTPSPSPPPTPSPCPCVTCTPSASSSKKTCP